MAEEDQMLFDPTQKKKKKKKVISLDDLEDAKVVPLPEPTPPPEPIVENDFEKEKEKEKEKVTEKVADDLDLDDFSTKKKKKKKRKDAMDMDALGDALQNVESGNADGQDSQDANDVNGNVQEDDFKEYSYDELLKRVFDIMRAKNPNLVEGGKKKFTMKPPQVVRVGTKKTSFVNFTDICKILHRQPKHLLAFLLAELGTSGTVDGTNQLIIKGRFQQKHIENVLRRYIKEYVTCHTCRSADTILHKETRLFFLQCETCGSRCSVQSIKSGFQAVTTKRAQLKNKQQ